MNGLRANVPAMSATPQTAFRSSAYRPGALGLVAEGVTEIWSRRRLIRYLVRADLKKRGTDTLLGNVWWVIDPLLLMAVYVILVTVITQKPLPDYPLFIFSAILPWKWFTASTSDSISSVSGQERLIKQLHFPKVIFPVASSAAEIVGFLFGLIPLAALMLLFYRDRISPWLLLIPVVAVVQYAFTLALAFLVSAINVFYRDVANVSRHALRLWFYLSPGLYSVKAIEEIAKTNPVIGNIMLLNPFATFFESYRNLIYNVSAPLWGHLAAWFVLSILFGALTLLFFKRVEPSFAKVL